MTKPKTLGIIVFASLCFAGLGCSKAPEVWPNKPGKRVLVSMAPLYCFAQNVAGDDAVVLCMSSEDGPHGKQITQKDVLSVRKADLVLCNGLELDEPFVEKMIKASDRKVKLVEVADDKTIDDSKLIHSHHEEEKPEPKGKHDHKHDHAHHHGEHDPHVWLSPELAILMVDRIAEELSQLDPDHKEGYMKRAADYKGELKKLHEHGLKAFADKKNKKFVVHHDSFGYFAQAFKLPPPLAINLASGIDSDAGARAELVKKCKAENVAVICYEPQTRFKKSDTETLQRTLKNEGVDATLILLDPIETAPPASAGSPNPDPGYYVKTMYANIDNLAKALK